MKSTLNILVVLISLLICNTAFSQPSTDVLSACLADNLNGKERKSLAKWIFFSMGSHPEIKSYMSVTQRDTQTSDEYVGRLITRLLTNDCAGPFKAAYKTDPTSLKNAFEVVGKVAMQELMTSTEVNTALTNYIKFADIDKIEKAMKQP